MRQRATLTDYIEWRGDLGYNQVPFNDVDNLVLACVSYLDFRGIVPDEADGGHVPLSDACRTLREMAGDDIDPYVRSLAKFGPDFIDALIASRRFGEATLSCHEWVFDEESATQFSAICIDLPSGETYVSFRGTDSTLAGWHEDMDLSFRITAAQELARRYLGRALGRYPGGRLLVGGHSKGGALAEYAAARRDDDHGRIIRVYSNDGPGLDPRIDPIGIREALGDRLRLIVPEYSIVGMLYAEDDDPRRIFVKSTASRASQHDPTTWLVAPTGFCEADGITPECAAVREGIARWADGIPFDERERIVREVFEALGAGGAKTVFEVTATANGMQQVAKALDGCDDRTKKAAYDLADSIISSSLSLLSKSMRERVDRWRQSLGMALGPSAVKLLVAKTPPRDGETGESDQSDNNGPQGNDG